MTAASNRCCSNGSAMASPRRNGKSLLTPEKQAIFGFAFDFGWSFQALTPEPPYIGAGILDSRAAIFRSEAGNSMHRATIASN
jgi:hypothetical protein